MSYDKNLHVTPNQMYINMRKSIRVNLFSQNLRFSWILYNEEIMEIFKTHDTKEKSITNYISQSSVGIEGKR